MRSSLLWILVLLVATPTTRAIAQFAQPQLVSDVPHNGALLSVDLDGDTDLDLLGLFQDDELYWIENTDGSGAFSTPVLFATAGSDCQQFLVGDLDNDGPQDVLLVKGDEFSWVRNLGGGLGDQESLITTLDDVPDAVVLADVTGDGLLDITYLVNTDGGAGVGILVNSATGFGQAQFFPDPVDGLATHVLVAADMDLVGGTDLVLSTTFNDLMILRNVNGDGSVWQPAILLAGAPYAYTSPRALDVDDDGDLDLVEASNSAVHWAENTVGEGGSWNVFTEHVLEEIWTSGAGAFGSVACDGVSLVYVPANPFLPVRWSSWLEVLNDFGYRIDRPDLQRGQRPQLVDLNGDGLDDLILDRPEGTFWYPGNAVPATTDLILPDIEPHCVFGAPLPLPAVEPAGGRWSGTWVDQDILYRSNLGADSDVLLAHTYYEPTACPVAERDTILLLTGPRTFPEVPTILCSADAPIVMTSLPSTTTWFGLEAGNLLDPAQFAGGIVACEMVDPTSTSCATLLGPLQVWNSLPAQIAPAGPFCVDAGPQSITALASPPQGAEWSGDVTPQTPFQSLFDPSQGAGYYTVIMNVFPTAPQQCANSDTLLILVTDDHPVVTLPSETTFCQGGSAFPLVATPPDGVWSGAGVVNNELVPALLAVGSNSLTYTATSATGCATVASYIVQVHDAISVGWNVEDLIFCKTDAPAFLNASPAGGQWSAPVWIDGEFVPATVPSGTYPVTYSWTGPNACELISDTITLTVWSDLDVSLEPTFTVCVQSTEAEITGSHPGVWSGSVAGLGQSIVFSPASLGVGEWPISLTAEADGFCPATADAMIIVEFCSGLDEVGSRELSVAPNPFTDLFVLRAEGGQILRVEVLDASGRKVLDQRPGVDQCAMDLGAAPAGMYTLRVITSFGMQHLRLVKQ